MAAELSLQTRVSGCLAIGGVTGHDRELTCRCRQVGGRDSGRASGIGSGRSRSAPWLSSVPCPDPGSTASSFFSGSSFSVRSQFARHPWRSAERRVGLWSLQNCDERSGRRRWLITTPTTLLGHFSCLGFERAGKRENVCGVPLTPRKPWIRQGTSRTSLKGDQSRGATCRASAQQRGFERRARRGGQRKPKDAGGGVATPSRKLQEQQVEREDHVKEEDEEEEEEDGEWDISEEEFEKLFDELEMELQAGVRMGEYTEADLGNFDIDEEELRQFAREFGEEEGVSAEYAENDEDDGKDGDEETEESDDKEDGEKKRRGRSVQEAPTASLGKERGDLPTGARTAAPHHSTTSVSSMDAHGDESADEGDDFHDDDDDDDDDDDLISTEEDLEGPEAVRTVHLEPWQLKRLAKALDKGRRHVNIKALAGDTKLDRSDVLAFLKNPPVELLVQMSLGRENQRGGQNGTEEGDSLSVSDANRRTKQPWGSQFEDGEGSRQRDARMRRGGRDFNKRMKKVDIATLERVYERTKRPTDAMVMNLVELTHLPRKEILSWFSARRESEQSHFRPRTLGDLQTFESDSFRPRT